MRPPAEQAARSGSAGCSTLATHARAPGTQRAQERPRPQQTMQASKQASKLHLDAAVDVVEALGGALAGAEGLRGAGQEPELSDECGLHA